LTRAEAAATRFSGYSEPGNLALEAFAAIPVSLKVAAHSIATVEGDGPVDPSHDSIVRYQSAHIPEAKPELVARSDHLVQADPRTVSEVRRILLIHLAEACPQGCTLGLGCPIPRRRALSSGSGL
jgi:hypothetical protein